MKTLKNIAFTAALALLGASAFAQQNKDIQKQDTAAERSNMGRPQQSMPKQNRMEQNKSKGNKGNKNNRMPGDSLRRGGRLNNEHYPENRLPGTGGEGTRNHNSNPRARRDSIR